jgi:hypothetical protein
VSEETKKPTAKERIAAAEAARRELAAAEETAFEEQRADDIEATLALEREHGRGRIHAIPIDFDAWKPGVGAATRLVCLLPLNSDRKCKRFLNVINNDRAKAREKTEAGDQLGESCVIYPKVGSEMYEATIEHFALILQLAAIAISEKVRGRRAEQGK